jgi:hypothetical protein
MEPRIDIQPEGYRAEHRIPRVIASGTASRGGAVTQNILIILRCDEAKAAEFEAGFAERILPLWEDHHGAGRLIAGSLTPADVGAATGEVREAI